jgi:hypothetical protein
MFVIAFEGAWLARKRVVLRVLALVFVFDPYLIEEPIDSVETLCRECCWLGRQLGTLVRYSCLWIQFVLGGVVSPPGVRSYEKVTVVVPS